MPSTSYSLLRVPAVRVTKLDACGVYVPTGSSVTSKGLITIEQEPETEDRDDFFQKNADGEFCIKDTNAPQLKWINLTLTFCQVNPELYNIITAEPLVMDDDTVPKAVGFRTREGSVAASNFAFESWSRVAGANACSGGEVQYGYFLLPWVVEGMVGALTMENGNANFTVTARTRSDSPWGLGPYNIRRIQSGASEGQPAPLLTAIASTDHRHMQLTTLAPPVPATDAIDVTQALTVTDPGVGTTGSMTIPAGITLPAVVDWGDLSSLETIPAGTTGPVVHTYAGAGTYTVKLRSTANSGPTFQGDVVVS
jgi:hypothetical protein